MKKSSIRVVFIVIIMTCLFAMTAGASVTVKKAVYEGKGRVDVDFSSKVSYRKAKISVRDAKGNKVRAVILERDDEDLDFRLSNWKQGKTYTFTISGIKKQGEEKYGSVKGKIRIPVSKGAVSLKKAEYDSEDHEVCFTFSVPVEWKNPKVTITKGKSRYALRIVDRDRDEIEVRVKSLVQGEVYRYKITGIRKKGAGRFSSISGSFTA